MARLADLLAQIITASEAADPPALKTHMLISRCTDPGSTAVSALRIDQYLLRPLGDGTGVDLRLVAEGMSGVGELGGSGSWNEMAHLAPAVAFDGSAVH